MEIKLTNCDEYVLIDETDYPLVSEWKWHKSSGGYAVRSVEGGKKKVFMHRVILDANRGQLVDHKNHVKLDNRRDNLRFATSSQNNANSFKKISGGYRGVWKDGNYFRAKVRKDRKFIHSTSFDTPEEAAREYDKMALQLHGDFAVLNFG